MPGIHNRLVSCIDLDARGQAARTSPVFYRRLLTEALERIRGFHPRRVLDLMSLRRAGVFAACGVAALVLAWWLFSPRLPTAMARIFLPFADIPPASAVVYEVQPGRADILRDEEITFTATVTSAQDPQELRLELYGDGGVTPLKYDLKADRRDPKRWAVAVDGASLGDGYKNGFRYRVYGG